MSELLGVCCSRLLPYWLASSTLLQHNLTHSLLMRLGKIKTRRDSGAEVQLLKQGFELDVDVRALGYLLLLFLAKPPAKQAPEHPAAHALAQ